MIEAFDLLSSRHCPPPHQGDEILEMLLNHFDFQTFSKVCHTVNRGWAPTNSAFNERILDRVFKGDTRWLATMLDTGMTQTDFFAGVSSRNPKYWLVEIVNRGFDQWDGWQHVQRVMREVPLVGAGAFGRLLMKSNADPDLIPQAIVKELRKIEEHELHHRRWCAQDLGSRPSSSFWSRANTPLSQLIHRTKVGMENISAEAAEKRIEHFKTCVLEFVKDGARGDALSHAEPIIGELGSIELWFDQYSEDECLPKIKSSFVEVFEMLAQGIRMDTYLRSPHAPGETETLAMLFADHGASLCAHLSIKNGGDPYAVDHNGNTWKMRMLQQTNCLDIGDLNEFDISHKNKKGETVLHLIAMPSFVKSAPFHFGEKQSPAREAQMLNLLRQAISKGLSFDETDAAGNTPSGYLKMGEARYAHLMAQVISEKLNTDTSPGPCIQVRTRRI